MVNMTDREYIPKKISYIEHLAADKFSIELDVASVLFDDIQTGDQSYATIFQCADGEVYVLHEDTVPVALVEVASRMKSLGVKVGGFFPPNGDKSYFDKQGYEIFKQTYPGRTIPTEQERAFYEYQSPYNPAIMLVERVSGEIRRYNSASGAWKSDSVFTYSRQEA